ncbi:MAG TPA: hypothetical protein VGN83_16860 [Falsiroseomonas sp.]|jgi:hypothetical protein|nr:hypothetical protein [Falsiroseomonas sp.]
MQMIVGRAAEAQAQPEQTSTVRGISDRARVESERRLVGRKPEAERREAEPAAPLRDAA